MVFPFPILSSHPAIGICTVGWCKTLWWGLPLQLHDAPGLSSWITRTLHHIGRTPMLCDQLYPYFWSLISLIQLTLEDSGKPLANSLDYSVNDEECGVSRKYQPSSWHWLVWFWGSKLLLTLRSSCPSQEGCCQGPLWALHVWQVAFTVS